MFQLQNLRIGPNGGIVQRSAARENRSEGGSAFTPMVALLPQSFATGRTEKWEIATHRTAQLWVSFRNILLIEKQPV